MHSALPTCQSPFMVRSLQLVEVRPYAEEEEDNMVGGGQEWSMVTSVKPVT